MESMEQTLTGSADFGKKVTSIIARNGDLIHKGFLQIELPELAVAAGAGTVAWTRHVGHVMIDEISVEIGGATIDRQLGIWMQIYSQLTESAEKQDGFAVMIGDMTPLTEQRETHRAATLFVPLQFWFNRNPGLALPLIALMYHDVKINIAFKPWTDLVIFGGGADRGDLTAQPSLRNVSLFLDYIFLDAPERKMFSQLNHEYLIEQIQYQGSESQNSGSSLRLRTSFSHPCKELVIAIRPNANVENGANRWTDFTYGSADNNLFDPTRPAAGIGYNGSDPLRDAKIQLNATDRTSVMPAAYWGIVQPYYHHTNIPNTGIYLYSFALKPEEHQPSGTLNASRIEGLNVVMTLNTGTAGVTIFPFAVNYNVLRITSGMGGLRGPQECLLLKMLVRYNACNISKLLGIPKVTAAIKLRKMPARKQCCECYNGQSAAKLLSELQSCMEKVQRLYGSGRTPVRLRDSLSRTNKGKPLGTNCGIRFLDGFIIEWVFRRTCHKIWVLFSSLSLSKHTKLGTSAYKNGKQILVQNVRVIQLRQSNIPAGALLGISTLPTPFAASRSITRSARFHVHLILINTVTPHRGQIKIYYRLLDYSPAFENRL
jgi:major capsid protein